MIAFSWLPTSTLLLALVTLASSQSAPPPPSPAGFASGPALRLSVLHRVLGQAEWFPRGYLELNPSTNDAKFVPMANAWDKLDWLASLQPGELEYQLAVAGKKGEDGKWEGLNSIILPKCEVGHPAGQVLEERFAVYVGDDVNEPTFEGFRHSTNNNACKATQSDSFKYDGQSVVKVSFAEVIVPEPVRLTPIKEEAPVKVGADGKIVAPEPEKTFLQKYWVYLVAGLLVILVSGGGEEPAKK